MYGDDPIPALKQQLAAELVRLMDGWNEATAAAWIETDQPRVSDIRNGKLARFSLETLIRYVDRLSQVVTITVSRPPRRKPGTIRGRGREASPSP